MIIYSDDAPPAPTEPVAAFSATPLTGNAPLTVQLTDASTGTGPLTYAWDFNNDGNVDSTAQNPSFVYTTAGTYTVKLTVTNAIGRDDETASITVTPSPTMDILFDGTVSLTPDATFTQVAYNSGLSYTVEEDTPLGALHATGLTYDETDIQWPLMGIFFWTFWVVFYQKTPRKAWYAYVNDVYKDGLKKPAGALNLIELADGEGWSSTTLTALLPIRRPCCCKSGGNRGS